MQLAYIFVDQEVERNEKHGQTMTLKRLYPVIYMSPYVPKILVSPGSTTSWELCVQTILDQIHNNPHVPLVS